MAPRCYYYAREWLNQRRTPQLYNELYEAWRNEKISRRLQPLPKDFYARLAEYVRIMREESRMLDEKTARARLLMHEAENVRKMLKELILLRHERMAKLVLAGETVQVEGLTRDEEKFLSDVTPLFESFHRLLNDVVNGRFSRAIREQSKKRVLRFLKETPAIIGADMKTYGPFLPQDVASVPIENARVLIKQGVAVEVEVKLESA